MKNSRKKNLKNHRTTIRDIAVEAGVSSATVSWALRDSPEVGKATANRIKALAKSMDYYPDAKLSKLMLHLRQNHLTNERENLAFVDLLNVDKSEKSQTTVDRENSSFNAALKRANELGYNLEIFHFGQGGLTLERLDKILWARGIRGVLIGPSPTPGFSLKGVNWNNFCGLHLGHSVVYPPLDRIDNHHQHALTTALTQLRKVGYRKIGMILSKYCDQRTEYNYSSNYLHYQSSLAPADQVPILIGTEKSVQPPAFRKWFEKHKPDSIIVSRVTKEFLEMTDGLGLTAPRNFGLAALDASDSAVSVSGVHQNIPERFQRAIEYLIMQLQKNVVGLPENPLTILINGRWVATETTARSPSVSHFG